jgi:oligosaccharide repeat unit polymerase
MRTALSFLLVTFALLLACLAILYHPKSAASVLVLLGLLAGTPIWVGMGRRMLAWFSRQDLFSPLVAYPLVYIVWFTIGSIDFLQAPSSMFLGMFDPIPPRVWLYAGIGLLCYLCGVILSLHADNERRLHHVSDFRITWAPGRLRVVLLVLGLIAAGTCLYVTIQNGIVALSPDSGELVYEVADKHHWVTTPYFFAAYTVFILLMAQLSTDPAHGGSRSRRAVVAGLLVLFVSFAGFGARSTFVPPVLTSVILFHYMRRVITFKTLAAVVLAMFMFLSAYGYVRTLTVDTGLPDTLTAVGMPAPIQPLAYSYLYFRYSVATLRDLIEVIPHPVPYQHGLMTFMPFQTLLPGHHHPADNFFKDILGNEFPGGAGQPATVLGPFYADFGVVGIAVGMFGWGLLLASLYRWMLRDRTAHSAMIYAWALQAGLFGMFAGIVVFLPTLLIPVSWLVLNGLMKPSAPRSITLFLPPTNPAQPAG